MKEISQDFINLHGIKDVRTVSGDGFAPFFLIIFKDGREIKGDITSADFDEIINTIKETILEYSVVGSRKRKLNKLCGHTTEEKPKS